MKKRRRPQSMRAHQRVQQMCGMINEDDLVDPREYFKCRPRRGRHSNRKTYQLCRQVAETLELVLSGECCDELLQAIQIEMVIPAPNASQLMIVVGCRDPVFRERKDEMLARLESQAGWLRSQIAAAINRKKVPGLRFAMIGI